MRTKQNRGAEPATGRPVHDVRVADTTPEATARLVHDVRVADTTPEAAARLIHNVRVADTTPEATARLVHNVRLADSVWQRHDHLHAVVPRVPVAELRAGSAAG